MRSAPIIQGKGILQVHAFRSQDSAGKHAAGLTENPECAGQWINRQIQQRSTACGRIPDP